jgi:hypothetical protein
MRINSLALAGMGDRELHVLRKRSAALGKFLDNHLKDVLKLLLRLLWRCSEGMTTFNGGNVGNIAPVVIAPANNLVVEERLHAYEFSLRSSSMKAHITSKTPPLNPPHVGFGGPGRRWIRDE